MISMKSIVFVLAGIILPVGGAFAQDAVELTGDVAHGKVLFESVGCYACHGLAGQGARMTGPRLSQTPIPFMGFLRILRHPLEQMPPYEAAVLSDRDAADIYAYVKQLPRPPGPNSIALLKLER